MRGPLSRPLTQCGGWFGGGTVCAESTSEPSSDEVKERRPKKTQKKNFQMNSRRSDDGDYGKVKQMT